MSLNKTEKSAKKIKYTKVAFALSVIMLIVWAVLGTTTSLAWFTDTTPVQKNTFNIGNLDITFFYKDKADEYQPIDYETNVFDDNALYEPGYVQVVYLKVVNNGNVPFEYKLAVDVNDVTVATSVLGNDIYLPNYLRFGVIFGDSEATLDRESAKLDSQGSFPQEFGTYPLNTYSRKDDVVLQPGDERFIALIVRMPEDVGNAANYRGDVVPAVKLGITATASQEGTLK